MSIDKEGRSELHYAALDGDTRKVAQLISEGASVNLQCKQGWTALHCAAQSNSPEIVMALIKAGAAIELKDVFGNTPLWRATMASKGNGAVIKILLEAGGDRNAQNSSGVSPLSLAKTIGNFNVVQFYEKP
ncbi:MAG: ankyrin repeat domain-containing protein [Gammaproteobacteria bacterium]|nr:ankyrin repeat domain-containing protein [Gammaproteobacteria bacterium]